MPGSAPSRWPLIGRHEVVRSLIVAVETGAGALIAGGAGVGKSRVLAAASESLRDDGVEIIEVSGAQAGTAVPLAPLLHLVDLDDDHSLARRVLAELRRRSLAATTVVAVDDAQHLDEASAALLHHVAASGACKLLLAVRTGEQPDAALTSLWKDEIVERLELSPLDRRQTNHLVHSVLGPTSRRALDWLWAKSRGHPLFLRELVTAATEVEALRSDGDTVDLVGAPPLSDRLTELIGQSIGRLGEQHLRGLVGLMLAQPLDVGSGGTLVGPAVLEDLLRSGLVGDRHGHLELAHPLYGEVAASTLSPTSTHAVRSMVAQHLTGIDGRELDVAMLLLDLGEPMDPGLLERATSQALRLRQGSLGVRLATALVAVDPQGSAWAQLGAAHAIEGDWEQADECYRMAIEETDSQRELEAVWLRWIASTFEYRDDPSLARDLAARAVKGLEGGAAVTARAWELKARMVSEPFEPVARDLRSLAGAADHTPESARMVEADLAVCAWHLGRPHEGLRTLRGGRALAERDVVYRSRVMQVQNALTVWTEGFDIAGEQLAELVTFAVETNDPDVALHAQAARILFHARAGRADATISQNPLLDSLALGATVSRWVSLFLAELAWAQCHHLKGASAAARTAELAATANEHVSEPLIELVRSRHADNQEAAVTHIREAIRKGQDTGLGFYELLAQREMTQVSGPDDETVRRMGSLVEAAGPGLADIYLLEAKALAAEDAVALTAAADAAERYGAIGLAWELNISAQIAHVRAGELAAALASEATIERLARELPHQTSPLLDRVEPVLTNREREVAAGLVAGLTNQEIAERLYISPKTVKSHLERIYKRLGVNSRHEVTRLVTSTRPTNA